MISISLNRQSIYLRLIIIILALNYNFLKPVLSLGLNVNLFVFFLLYVSYFFIKKRHILVSSLYFSFIKEVFYLLFYSIVLRIIMILIKKGDFLWLIPFLLICFFFYMAKDYLRYKYFINKSVPLSVASYSKYVYIKKIISRTNKKVDNIYILDDSTINAIYLSFFFGFKKCFIYTKGAIRKPHAFLGLITVHELGHIYNNHYLQKFLFLGFEFVTYLFYVIFIVFIFNISYFSYDFFLKTYIYLFLIQIFFKLLGVYIARGFEYQADSYVVKKTLNAEDYVKFLKYLSQFEDNSFISKSFSEHPSLTKRITYIRKLQENLKVRPRIKKKTSNS